MEGSTRQRILKCASENPAWTSKQVAECVHAGVNHVASEMGRMRRHGLLPRPLVPRGPKPKAAQPSSIAPALNGAAHVVAQLRAVRAEYAAKIAKIDQAIAALS